MPYSILCISPYMHPSAGGPPVVVQNFVREGNRLGRQSRVISTPICCKGDESSLQKQLEQLGPTTFLSPLEMLPVLRSGGQRSAHVLAADIVHVHFGVR
jgi:hypothetical protein